MFVAEIMAGSVMFDSNYELCYVNTIAWSDILTGPDAVVMYNGERPTQQPAQQCKCILLSIIFVLDFKLNTTLAALIELQFWKKQTLNVFNMVKNFIRFVLH